MSIILHQANGIKIGQRHDNGYINATALALAYKQATGKSRDVADWLSNKRTQETLQHLSAKTGIPTIQLYQVFRGSPENGGGTWLHPRLAVRFGIWLSDEFGYMVEEWVGDWFTAEKNPVKKPQKTRHRHRHRQGQPQPQLPPASLANIKEIQAQLQELEQMILVALGHCHITHNAVEQPVTDESINRVIHTSMHQQTTKLNAAIKQIIAIQQALALLVNISGRPLPANPESVGMAQEAVQQFLANLEVLKSIGLVGEWCVKPITDKQGRKWVAVRHRKVWPALEAHSMAPASVPSFQSILVLAGGEDRSTQRFVTESGDGQKTCRCWLLPARELPQLIAVPSAVQYRSSI